MGYGIELKNRITGETAKMRHPRLVRFYSRGVYSNPEDGKNQRCIL
ncbi:MAG: hypothetical protein ACLRIQ_12315 [Blautia wexlerae]